MATLFFYNFSEIKILVSILPYGEKLFLISIIQCSYQDRLITDFIDYEIRK